jgi:hypothetical protein
MNYTRRCLGCVQVRGWSHRGRRSRWCGTARARPRRSTRPRRRRRSNRGRPRGCPRRPSTCRPAHRPGSGGHGSSRRPILSLGHPTRHRLIPPHGLSLVHRTTAVDTRARLATRTRLAAWWCGAPYSTAPNFAHRDHRECAKMLKAPGPADLGRALDLGHERTVGVQRGHRRAAIVQVHQHAVVGVGDAVAGERGVGLRAGSGRIGVSESRHRICSCTC